MILAYPAIGTFAHDRAGEAGLYLRGIACKPDDSNRIRRCPPPACPAMALCRAALMVLTLWSRRDAADRVRALHRRMKPVTGVLPGDAEAWQAEFGKYQQIPHTASSTAA